MIPFANDQVPNIFHDNAVESFNQINKTYWFMLGKFFDLTFDSVILEILLKKLKWYKLNSASYAFITSSSEKR